MASVSSRRATRKTFFADPCSRPQRRAARAADVVGQVAHQVDVAVAAAVDRDAETLGRGGKAAAVHDGHLVDVVLVHLLHHAPDVVLGMHAQHAFDAGHDLAGGQSLALLAGHAAQVVQGDQPVHAAIIGYKEAALAPAQHVIFDEAVDRGAIELDPRPVNFVEKKGSNRRALVVSSMPQPVSRTSTNT